MKHRAAGCPFGGHQHHPLPASAQAWVRLCVSPWDTSWPCSAPPLSSTAPLCCRGSGSGQVPWCLRGPGSFPTTPLPSLPAAPHAVVPTRKHTRVHNVPMCPHSLWHLPARPVLSRQRGGAGGVVRGRSRVPARKGNPPVLCGRLALTTSLLCCAWKSPADRQPRITSFSIAARSAGRGAMENRSRLQRESSAQTKQRHGTAPGAARPPAEGHWAAGAGGDSRAGGWGRRDGASPCVGLA